MISIALAVLLSQVQPSRAQVAGAVNTIAAAWIDRANRAKTFNADHTRVCIAPALGKTLTGRTTIRFGVLIFSDAAQIALTMPPPSSEVYGVAEVQIDPDLPTDHLIVPRSTLNAVVDVIPSEIEVRESALLPTQEVCFVRRDAPEISSALLFRCACAQTPSTCTWTRQNQDGSTDLITPAPTAQTFDPGAFSGSGCKRKPCVARFDARGVDNSWPIECPQ